MTPNFLKQLIVAFENCPEAKQFIITPPKNPGSMYLFSSPFFHISTQTYSTTEPSSELMLIASTLNHALKMFVMDTLTEHAAAIMQIRPAQLATALQEELCRTDDALPFVVGNPVNPTPCLGLKTTVGIFLIMPVEEIRALVLQKKGMQHAGRASELGGGRDFATSLPGASAGT